jgi:hypothetical protein
VLQTSWALIVALSTLPAPGAKLPNCDWYQQLCAHMSTKTQCRHSQHPLTCLPHRVSATGATIYTTHIYPLIAKLLCGFVTTLYLFAPHTYYPSSYLLLSISIFLFGFRSLRDTSFYLYSAGVFLYIWLPHGDKRREFYTSFVASFTRHVGGSCASLYGVVFCLIPGSRRMFEEM